jgi:hypothetical protein
MIQKKVFLSALSDRVGEKNESTPLAGIFKDFSSKSVKRISQVPPTLPPPNSTSKLGLAVGLGTEVDSFFLDNPRKEL